MENNSAPTTHTEGAKQEPVKDIFVTSQRKCSHTITRSRPARFMICCVCGRHETQHKLRIICFITKYSVYFCLYLLFSLESKVLPQILCHFLICREKNTDNGNSPNQLIPSAFFKIAICYKILHPAIPTVCTYTQVCTYWCDAGEASSRRGGNLDL